VNFIDVYFRSGLYPMPLPNGLGKEAAGVVEAVGEGVTQFQTGDRVAYVSEALGAYSETRLISAAEVVKLPPDLSFEQGAAMMLQGVTAYYLLRRTYPVQSGQTILIHAAAGGVGLLVCQWAKALGATVIGTVSTDEKAALARAHGCDHAIIYTRENFTERVRELTGGVGVPVVYDSIGKDTFVGSLDALAPLGMMVSFGNASGKLDPINAGMLTARGSLFFTRPTLSSYIAKRADREQATTELFEMVQSGRIKININQTYALKDAAHAHRDLQARRTTGSTVLLP
jgi:NADPH2:quinone reductase